MLSATPIIGFIPTRDANRALEFYEKTLGLHFVSDDGFALVFKSAKNMIRIARVQELTPPPYTIHGWEVTDIVAWIASHRTAMQSSATNPPGAAPNKTPSLAPQKEKQ